MNLKCHKRIGGWRSRAGIFVVVCSCLLCFNVLFQCLFLFVHLLYAGNRQHGIVVEWPNMAKPSEMILSLQYLIGVGAFWLWCEFPNQAAVEIAIWSSVAGSMVPLQSTHGRSDMNMRLQTFVIGCDLLRCVISPALWPVETRDDNKYRVIDYWLLHQRRKQPDVPFMRLLALQIWLGSESAKCTVWWCNYQYRRKWYPKSRDSLEHVCKHGHIAEWWKDWTFVHMTCTTLKSLLIFRNFPSSIPRQAKAPRRSKHCFLHVFARCIKVVLSWLFHCSTNYQVDLGLNHSESIWSESSVSTKFKMLYASSSQISVGYSKFWVDKQWQTSTLWCPQSVSRIWPPRARCSWAWKTRKQDRNIIKKQ